MISTQSLVAARDTSDDYLGVGWGGGGLEWGRAWSAPLSNELATWEWRLRFLYKHHQWGDCAAELNLDIYQESPCISCGLASSWTTPDIYSRTDTASIKAYSSLLLGTWDDFSCDQVNDKSKCHSGLEQSPSRGRVNKLFLSLEAEYKCQLDLQLVSETTPNWFGPGLKGAETWERQFFQHAKLKGTRNNSVIKINIHTVFWKLIIKNPWDDHHMSSL